MAGCAARPQLVKKLAPGSYCISGKTYQTLKKVPTGFSQNGIASWYGPKFHGRKTASGEIYNMHDFTAAHTALPMNTLVKVTNLRNGKNVLVRINDRGPFVDGRIIDLSHAAASKLDVVSPGTDAVKLTVVGNVPKQSARIRLAQKRPTQTKPNPFFSAKAKPYSQNPFCKTTAAETKHPQHTSPKKRSSSLLASLWPFNR